MSGPHPLGETQSGKPIHILIDSSGLAVHVGQFRKPPKNRGYRKLHISCVEIARQRRATLNLLPATTGVRFRVQVPRNTGLFLLPTAAPSKLL